MVRESEKQGINVLSLGDLLLQAKTQEDNQNLMKLLSSFSCDKDKDVESFLHNRAIDFERLNKSRTYLLCDDEILDKEGRIIILGYFSLSLKVLDLSENLSNRKRKMLDGISAKLHGEVIRSVPCYLIGQLAKNSNIPNTISVSGAEMINCAMSIIRSAETVVGGRYVLIECHNNPKLLKFYTENSFEIFEKLPFGNVPMIQMLRTLCETAI
ncbi:MAG: hypothetical protein NC452_21515 [Eubacterium sp.]|nr:hypothetical protein [Eubacterium sp.]